MSLNYCLNDCLIAGALLGCFKVRTGAYGELRPAHTLSPRQSVKRPASPTAACLPDADLQTGQDFDLVILAYPAAQSIHAKMFDQYAENVCLLMMTGVSRVGSVSGHVLGAAEKGLHPVALPPHRAINRHPRH